MALANERNFSYSGMLDEPIYVQMLAPDFGTLMQSALTVFDTDTVRAARFLHELMARDECAFRAHASRELRAHPGTGRWKFLIGMLSGNGMLIEVLLDPMLLTMPETARLLGQTSGLASWVAAQIAGRTAREPHTLEPAAAARIIGMAAALDDPGRMLPVLIDLSEHECEWVRSKAELAICRATGDLGQIESASRGSNARSRAGAVEALWWLTSTRAILLFRSAGRDSHHRVAANAALGLDLAGRTDEAVELARRMAIRPEAAFRLSAVWTMREMGAERFTAELHGLLYDPAARVRSRAQDALIRLRGIN